MHNEQHLEYLTKHNSKWWVKFNKINGIILKVSAREIPEPDEYQENISIASTSNELIGQVIKRTLPKKWVRMVYDVVNEVWEPATETTTLHIEDRGISILKVTGKNPNNNDIYINVFKDTNTVEIKANRLHIQRSLNISQIDNISSSDSSLVNFYICAKHNPDRLLHVIEIDPITLIKERQLRFTIDKDIDWDNVSFFTRPMFTSYGIEYYNVSQNLNKQFVSDRLLQTVSFNDVEPHLTIVKSEGGVKILNRTTEDTSYTTASVNKIMFLVCDGHIDKPIGAFGVSGDKLREVIDVDIKTKFKWPEKPLIVYKSNTLSVNYVGETDAQQH